MNGRAFTRESGSDARWARFYDRLAPFYAWSERVLGRWLTGVDILAERRALAALIPLATGQRVLEVSPGPGIWQPDLASKVGPEGWLSALDISRGMLDQCRRRCVGQVPEPRLVRGNGSRLPYATSAFDGLFHFGGINLFAEPGQALEEFARVVRPGGWVVFGDEQFSPAWLARDDWRVRLLRRMNPGYLRQPPLLPPGLLCESEHAVMGGLGYLKCCRVIR